VLPQARRFVPQHAPLSQLGALPAQQLSQLDALPEQQLSQLDVLPAEQLSRPGVRPAQQLSRPGQQPGALRVLALRLPAAEVAVVLAGLRRVVVLAVQQVPAEVPVPAEVLVLVAQPAQGQEQAVAVPALFARCTQKATGSIDQEVLDVVDT
jgi:hypothetical protein